MMGTHIVMAALATLCQWSIVTRGEGVENIRAATMPHLHTVRC